MNDCPAGMARLASWRIGLLLMPLVSIAMLCSSSQRAEGQEGGDPAAGKRLAETWCSSCHVVGPASQRGTSTSAPTFAAVARMKSTTPMSLRVFLQTPHAVMPDLHLSRDEIAGLAAYILSLRRE